MTEIKKIAFCPHCGNRAPQKLIFDHRSEDIGWVDGEEGEEEIPLPAVDYVGDL